MPVRFGQSIDRFIVRTAVLDRPLAPSRLGAQLLERHLQELAKAALDRTGTTASHAAFVIATRLESGPIDLPAVAGEMGISARTRQRRLEAKRVTFRAIVEEHRQRTAEELIASGKIPIKHVAEMLGYSESTTLSRAFKPGPATRPARLRAGGGPKVMGWPDHVAVSCRSRTSPEPPQRP